MPRAEWPVVFKREQTRQAGRSFPPPQIEFTFLLSPGFLGESVWNKPPGYCTYLPFGAFGMESEEEATRGKHWANFRRSRVVSKAATSQKGQA